MLKNVEVVFLFFCTILIQIIANSDMLRRAQKQTSWTGRGWMKARDPGAVNFPNHFGEAREFVCERSV